MDYRHVAIPQHRDHQNWQSLVIQEDGSKLISVPELDSQYIKEQPQYYLWDIPHALKHCYVREEVAEKLMEAAKQLPVGYKFLIWDGYRPFEVQKALYDQFFSEIEGENPGLKEEEIHTMTKKYVSYPTRNRMSPAPHITGGAVDLTIVNKNEEPLYMGTDFDAFTQESATRFFEGKIQQGINLSKKEELALENRRLLYHILSNVGFTNYPEEWWHFDFGNQWWAKQSNASYAMFGLTDL